MFEEKLVVKIGGYEPDEYDYTDQTIEISEKELNKILPDMIHCLVDKFIKVIESPGHPFDGWQIMTLSFDRIDKPTETEEDLEWNRLSELSKHKGTDFSKCKLDDKGHFVEKVRMPDES